MTSFAQSGGSDSRREEDGSGNVPNSGGEARTREYAADYQPAAVYLAKWAAAAIQQSRREKREQERLDSEELERELARQGAMNLDHLTGKIKVGKKVKEEEEEGREGGQGEQETDHASQGKGKAREELADDAKKEEDEAGIEMESLVQHATYRPEEYGDLGTFEMMWRRRRHGVGIGGSSGSPYDQHPLGYLEGGEELPRLGARRIPPVGPESWLGWLDSKGQLTIPPETVKEAIFAGVRNS